MIALQDAAVVRIPTIVCHGHAAKTFYLVLEWLSMRCRGNETHLGTHLATLHRIVGPHFGWHCDNLLGTFRQTNATCATWCDFWRAHRLLPQLEMASTQPWGATIVKNGQHLLDQLGPFFDDHHPIPSLLHGDLWHGNVGWLDTDTPVLFDPAVHYGDRETDLAMTELFGGFGPSFYSAYQTHYPLQAGYPRRRPLYQLYHVLNHANFFGGGYIDHAHHLLMLLLKSIG